MRICIFVSGILLIGNVVYANEWFIQHPRGQCDDNCVAKDTLNNQYIHLFTIWGLVKNAFFSEIITRRINQFVEDDFYFNLLAAMVETNYQWKLCPKWNVSLKGTQKNAKWGSYSSEVWPKWKTARRTLGENHNSANYGLMKLNRFTRSKESEIHQIMMNTISKSLLNHR